MTTKGGKLCYLRSIKANYRRKNIIQTYTKEIEHDQTNLATVIGVWVGKSYKIDAKESKRTD